MARFGFITHKNSQRKYTRPWDNISEILHFSCQSQIFFTQRTFSKVSAGLPQSAWKIIPRNWNYWRVFWCYGRLVSKTQKTVDRNDKVKAWKLEEKQTDVNIALHMYRDVSKGHTEQVILVSNDSDLAPALQAIREDFPDARLGAVMPIMKRTQSKSRPPNANIKKYTDWTRSHINESELSSSQLPEKIPTNKKPIFKPDYWWYMDDCLFLVKRDSRMVMPSSET